jgi:hypothetical protein
METIQLKDSLGNIVEVSREVLVVGDTYVIKRPNEEFVVSDMWSDLYITGTVTEIRVNGIWTNVYGTNWRGNKMLRFADEFCFKVVSEADGIQEKRDKALAARDERNKLAELESYAMKLNSLRFDLYKVVEHTPYIEFTAAEKKALLKAVDILEKRADKLQDKIKNPEEITDVK